MLGPCLVLLLAAAPLLAAPPSPSPPPAGSVAESPESSRPVSDLDFVLEGARRVAADHAEALAAMVRYGETSLRVTLPEDPPAVLVAARSRVLGTAPPPPATAGLPSPSVLLEGIFMLMKRDALVTQVQYEGTPVSGLPPLAWYLLAAEIPSQNTFTFDRAVQYLDDLFDEDAVALLFGALDGALRSGDPAGLVKAYETYLRNRAAPGADDRAVASCMGRCDELARRYVRWHGTSYRRVAELMAVVHDVLAAARHAGGPSAAAAVLAAVWVDLRMVGLRLADAVPAPSAPPSRGRAADDQERVVRETLIYGTRLLRRGFTPPGAAPSSEPAADPHEVIRRLELLQGRLLQIRMVQRRALRAAEEHGRLLEDHAELVDAPAWMYAELRARLAELDAEIRGAVYGGGPRGVPSADSVEGLLFDPALEAELLEAGVGRGGECSRPGVAGARREVLGLLDELRRDHEDTLLTYLQGSDERTAAARSGTSSPATTVSTPVARARADVVAGLLASRRDAEGALLTPGQTRGLEQESRRLRDILLPPAPPSVARTAPATMPVLPSDVPSRVLPGARSGA